MPDLDPMILESILTVVLALLLGAVLGLAVSVVPSWEEIDRYMLSTLLNSKNCTLNSKQQHSHTGEKK